MLASEPVQMTNQPIHSYVIQMNPGTQNSLPRIFVDPDGSQALSVRSVSLEKRKNEQHFKGGIPAASQLAIII